MRGSLREGVPAIVTGGARGIGAAVARRLAAEGAAVTVADIDGDAAARMASTIAGARALQLDVTDAAAVDRAFDEAPQPYEIVVANAGVGTAGAPVVATSDEEWHRVLGVNLHGVFYTLRAAGRRLLGAGLPGRIIVTASIAGLAPEADAAPYCASKFAVIGLLRSMAVELAPHGILVNGVCPGDVRTELHAEFGVRERAAQSSIPIGRLAEPEDVAGVYAMLAGPDGAYITGETVVIDGGILANALGA
ncbi:MAG: SDR family oxidoreductase [Actinomycetota bacterium]|jgi:NAD(P)-dependent dehydrogenase (short-subunit alcohol dehydrogenase family)|nr:MAG: SDR family oxidoreductase [Actinomycetota bacterium]